MLFNSLEFLFLFLPLTLLIFYTVPPSWRVPVLGLSSAVFYGASGLIALAAMIFAVIWAYTFALISYGRQPRILLVAAILPPLLILFLFKYLNFTLAAIGAGVEARIFLSPILTILLPAGISFYTFQIVAYSIDVFDRRIKPERNPITLWTFFAAFPQLIAGPILRYDDLNQQLKQLQTQVALRPNFVAGFKYISIGLFAKICIADIINTIISNPEQRLQFTSLDALYSIFAYSFQIYFDFWAYSLMAIGLGKLLCLDIAVNFREPYLAENPRDFWRRWHVTLSFWLRDYVYIRLGGNKRYVPNIVIIFLICGLWHGAGWNFIVWGAYHAVLVIGYHWTRRWWDPVPRPLKIALTFILVSFGWPLFQFNLETYLKTMELAFGGGSFVPNVFSLKHWLFLAAVMAFTFLWREKDWLYNVIPRRVLDSAAVHAVLAVGAILLFEFRQTFIYFRF